MNIRKQSNTATSVVLSLLLGLIPQTILTSAAQEAQKSGPSQAERIRKLEDSIRQLQVELEQLKEEQQQLKPPAREAADVRLFWKDGLNFRSADGKTFTGKLGGRIQLDAAGFAEDSQIEDRFGDLPAGLEFRRVRLFTEGELSLATPVFYKLELDFADAEVAFKDVFLGLADLPVVGKLQAGHFKEPVSLEMLASSRFISFMERPLPVEAFAPERNTGAMLMNTALDDRLSWAVGGFTDTGDDAEGVPLDSDYRFTGRITGLPWYDKESKGSRLLHLGISGSYMNLQDNRARFRSRPEAHLAPRFVDTGDFPADNSYLFGAEAALVCGPFSLQGEYLRNWVDQKAGDTASFDGFYVYGSWFVTGEHRVYRLSSAVFDRLRPKRNFSLNGGGLGAWELLIRYSRLDLNDSGISGGKLQDITAGVSWYLNPNTKLMLNYVFADLDRGGTEGDSHALQTRFQIDF